MLPQIQAVLMIPLIIISSDWAAAMNKIIEIFLMVITDQIDIRRLSEEILLEPAGGLNEFCRNPVIHESFKGLSEAQHGNRNQGKGKHISEILRLIGDKFK